MRIADAIGKGAPVFSCEFFAPKTEKGAENLGKVLRKLKRINPGFYSVTYGAGGSTARPTLSLVESIEKDLGVTAMAHLTCVNHSARYLGDYLTRLKESGIINLFVLRGDTPGGEEPFEPHPEGFSFASEVVELAMEFDHFCIGVAGHPEGHPDASSLEEDVRNLKKKVDAGAEFVLTQFFFRNEYYYHFVEMAEKGGVDVPIIPGVIPFVNAELVIRFARMNHTEIPDNLKKRMLEAGSDRDKSMKIGIEQATEQCADLLDNGVPGIHFFTLNNSLPTLKVMSELGYEP